METRRSRGFTLIELLVVVAIIALLISILLPSLGRAREQSKRVVCGSNMHQMLVAAQAYTTENRNMYPMTDGSWLDRPKKGTNNALGMGLLVTNGYMLANSALGAKVFFCPSAIPAWNWRQPGHLYKELGANLSSNNDAYCTYVGKFCTFVGYNTPTYPYQADLTTLTAPRISPILVMDYIANGQDITQSGSEGGYVQAHEAKGVMAGFHNGAAEWIEANRITITSSGAAWTGRWNNRNPYGSVWYWAQTMYGSK